jgi:hypothetical protein
MAGKFRILGWEWQMKIFQGRENAVRRKFVKELGRAVFVNQELMTQEQARTGRGI